MLFEWWERYHRVCVVAGIVLFVTVSWFLYSSISTEQAPVLPLETPAFALEKEVSTVQTAGMEQNAKSKTAPALAPSPVPNPIYVDVKGSVKQPGLYTFTGQERIADAITKAGGALAQADLNQINLAQPLADGSAVWVPAKGEIRSSVPGSTSPCNPVSTVTTATTQSSNASSGKINLNTATIQELATLPGIGETRAQTIIAYREKNGAFQESEGLKKIAGIGDKTYERLKDKITVK